MLKNAVLVLSLLINGAAAYVYYFPQTGTGPKMSCADARSELSNKTATEAFARANNGSLSKTHQFLRNSDYQLRSIHNDGGLTFVYVATRYPSTCGIHFPGIDGSIVRIRTDVQAEPLVQSIF